MRSRWKSAAARRIRELTGKATVEAAAAEIARRLTEGQECPPINLEAIFPRLAIQRAFADPKMAIAGELRRADDGFEIAYSPSDTLVRRRFTIAHEIAHAVFERTGPRCPRRGRELEKICNMIASEILVPESSLASTVGHRPLNFRELARLADTYGISLTALVLRCASRFSLIAAETMWDEITWFHCPSGVGLVAPRAQLQRLAKSTGSLSKGTQACSLELRGSDLAKTMEWTTTGEGRKLFVLSDRF